MNLTFKMPRLARAAASLATALVLLLASAPSSMAQGTISFLLPPHGLVAEGLVQPTGANSFISLMVDDIDIAEPGFKTRFNAWVVGGGQVATLDTGVARILSFAAINNGVDQIYLNVHPMPTAHELRIRLRHEFWHIENGGFLDDCQHACCYLGDLEAALAWCQMGHPIKCSQLWFLLDKMLEHNRRCLGVPACGVPVLPWDILALIGAIAACCT